MMNTNEMAKANDLTFGNALEVLKRGGLVSRTGWSGKGMFIFQRPEDTLSSDFLPNVKSLPQRVKDYYKKNNNFGVEPFGIKFTAYLCLKSVDGTIVNGWLPSLSDIHTEDWQVFEF